MKTSRKLLLAKKIITQPVVFLLDYPYFKENYKLIAIDLSKQQALVAIPKAIQQNNFTENVDPAVVTYIMLIS